MALQNKLKAFVRFDGSGRVIPSSLILQKSKPKVGDWKEINATQCCNAAPGTVVKISHDQMFDPVCTTSTTLAIQVGQGTSFSDAVTITGDFASLGAYYTPADPNNPMSQAPRFRIAYISEGVLKNREFTLIAVGVASGIGGMGPTQEQTCSSLTTTTTTTVAPTTTTTTTGVPVWQVFTFGAFNELDACAGSTSNPLFYASPDGSLGNGTALYYDSELTNPYSPSGNGTYLKMYFGAANQVCTMSGNIIQSYTAC